MSIHNILDSLLRVEDNNTFSAVDYHLITDAILRYHLQMNQRYYIFFCHDGIYRNLEDLLTYYASLNVRDLIEAGTGIGTIPHQEFDTDFTELDSFNLDMEGTAASVFDGVIEDNGFDMVEAPVIDIDLCSTTSEESGYDPADDSDGETMYPIFDYTT